MVAEPLSMSIDVTEIMEQADRFSGSAEVIADEMDIAMDASLDLIEEQVVVRTPVNIDLLRGSIDHTIFGEPPNFRGEVFTPLVYGIVVERGRRAGAKAPPIAPIIFWVRRKKIVFTRVLKSGKTVPLSIESTAFLIARAIGRRGIKGKFMFEKGFEAALPHVLRTWEKVPENIVARLGD